MQSYNMMSKNTLTRLLLNKIQKDYNNTTKQLHEHYPNTIKCSTIEVVSGKTLGPSTTFVPKPSQTFKRIHNITMYYIIFRMHNVFRNDIVLHLIFGTLKL